MGTFSNIMKFFEVIGFTLYFALLVQSLHRFMTWIVLKEHYEEKIESLKINVKVYPGLK